MKRLTEQLLAQYYDGELNEKEAAQVKVLLEHSSSDAASLSSMERLSDCFSIMQEESLEEVLFDGFDKRILNQIQHDSAPPSLSERIAVWFKEFFEHKKTVWIPTASLAGAACAALLAVSIGGGAPTSIQMPSNSTPEFTQTSTSSVSSEVNILEATGTTAEKFSLKNDQGQRIAVVWIDE